MNPKKVFEEKYALVASVKEKDPSLSSMTELLATLSNLSGKQRNYLIDKYMNLYSKKFSQSTVINRGGTKIWQLFTIVSNKVLLEGYVVSKEECEVLKSVLDIGQKVTIEGTVIPTIPEEEKRKYTELTNSYLKGNFKLKKEVKEAVDEISLILPA